MYSLSDPILAEEDTDSEDDGGPPHCGHRSQSRGRAGNRNGTMQDEASSQREILPFSAHKITDRQSPCPINHSHKISEEIDLSFKNNSKRSQWTYKLGFPCISFTVLWTPPSSLSTSRSAFGILNPHLLLLCSTFT